MSNRNSRGRFLTGNNVGPGRSRGSRNKLGNEFIVALYGDWKLHVAAAIEADWPDRPHEYLKLVASLIPKQMEDDELAHIIEAGRTALVDAEDDGDEQDEPLH